ncbi:SDR family oxidoreductase [Rhizobium paknamense]|uniref:NAD(P)-dependent dehydrogenase (Short-subunit alcohol dehydrogenase family) n=1 Tax=Rhizobium paknamense TaxID=1206817 RepID=A0ABU0IF73_9HYPH|nr:SDR family NAD(P)-dependent oxidoreductase [Rhizobium paknamense]MDQ0456898.1 NAD(P)-dependent dehydrogenase (short-subunit alcohol dehydrogenase family) [Rhizobium paknamense]
MERGEKVALVTGSGSGIGRATAMALAAQGMTVGLLGRTEEELQAVAREIRETGGEALVLVADVSDAEAMASAIASLVDEGGRLDVVVANAGINGTWAPIDDLQPEEWDKTMAVNLRGTYLTLHHSVPYLKREGGAVVVVSSINGTRTFTTPGATAYAATKAAQVAMVQQLALELGRQGIRINAVCPGAIDTRIDDNTEKRNSERAAIPIILPEGEIPLTEGQAGTAEDVADVIAFLTSDASRHVTGTAIFIDGGQSLVR